MTEVADPTRRMNRQVPVLTSGNEDEYEDESGESEDEELESSSEEELSGLTEEEARYRKRYAELLAKTNTALAIVDKGVRRVFIRCSCQIRLQGTKGGR